MAVSVPIVPSRLLRTFACAYAAVCIGMGGACLAGWLGPVQWQSGIGTLCLLAGICLLHRARVRPTAQRLDVSGPGSLVLTVQLEGGRASGAVRRIPVQLMAESTLWPGLLVLRLRGPPEDAPMSVLELVLLPDSVPDGEFRRLLVALRAVAGRSIETLEEREKIL